MPHLFHESKQSEDEGAFGYGNGNDGEELADREKVQQVRETNGVDISVVLPEAEFCGVDGDNDEGNEEKLPIVLGPRSFLVAILPD